MISLKIAEKPRNVKMDSKKPDVYRMLALIALQNKDIEKTKKALQEAKALNPNDQELIDGEFQLYFDLAYNYLKGEAAIVDEINKNLESKDKAKFDELMGKRKSLFKSSLPYLEKAHQLKPTDANTKNILKSAYEVLDMKDKLATIK
ncbi:MAG: hypothetical protein HC854_11005 [Flavobacterium sp.]|nr:hypothetical protein [Flavobacterium sp.]